MPSDLGQGVVMVDKRAFDKHRPLRRGSLADV